MIVAVQPTVALSEILEHHQGGLVFRAELNAVDEIVAAVVLGRPLTAGIGIEPGLHLALVFQLLLGRVPTDRMGEIQAKTLLISARAVDVRTPSCHRK